MSNQGTASAFNGTKKGGLAVWLSSLIAGESQERPALRTERRSRSVVITTATTTGISYRAGIIQEIRVVGGVAGNITVYDSFAASGRVLYPASTPTILATLLKGVAFDVGLTIVTASAMHVVVEYDELGGREEL